MILITYGTSEHFEKKVGDKYHCKSLASGKRKLKEVLENDEELQGLKGFKQDIMKQYSAWVLDKKTCFSVGVANISNATLYILVEEITLY